MDEYELLRLQSRIAAARAQEANAYAQVHSTLLARQRAKQEDKRRRRVTKSFAVIADRGALRRIQVAEHFRDLHNKSEED